MPSLVRLTRRGASFSSLSVDLVQESARFASENALHLPALIDGELLTLIQDQIDIDGFSERVHDRLPSRPVDLGLNRGRATALLLLLTNDARFLDFVRTLTCHPELRSFTGSVSRRVPGAGHEDAWHSDAVDGRLVALSINLGREPFEGGVLQIRDEAKGRIVYKLANTGPGDAVLIKIDARLKHRVTRPEGRAPRTVFAGWFVTEPVRQLLSLPRVSPV